MKVLFTILCLLLGWNIHAGERGSSAPYISGDTFRLACNHCYDELTKEIDPTHVQRGDSIFVKTDFLRGFFKKIHPHIAHPYILVTHNSDHSVPGPFAEYLNDSKIFAWFGQNVEGHTHPKLHPIPIGLANMCWGHGNIATVARIEKQKSALGRNHLLYLNFVESNFPSERSRVVKLFGELPYCYNPPRKPYGPYLKDLSKSKFVLSPRGNGIDCHRTWECLLLGAYPIVKTSSLDPLYQGLPVVIVQDWTDINEEFLRAIYKDMRNQTYKMNRAYSAYWLNLIEKAQAQARAEGF